MPLQGRIVICYTKQLLKQNTFQMSSWRVERNCTASSSAQPSSTASTAAEDQATDSNQKAEPEDTRTDTNILGEEGQQAKISAEAGVTETDEYPEL